MHKLKPKMTGNETVYEQAIAKWGKRAQLEMLQEEATELALATRKFIRKDDNKRFIDLAGEVADTLIMIEQLLYMFPNMKEFVVNTKAEKVKRLSDRLNEDRFED